MKPAVPLDFQVILILPLSLLGVRACRISVLAQAVTP
jgi:hypothetical protein